MKAIFRYTLLLCAIVVTISFQADDDLSTKVLSHVVDLSTAELRMYWKDQDGAPMKSFQNLKRFVESERKSLVFAMNGGMFNPDFSPTGLYIENGQELKRLNKATKGSGNFLLLPNGVFYLTKEGKAHIATTPEFESSDHIAYATQSGPMLLIDGEYHPAFNANSSNFHIRNGVGILPNGNVLFAMSEVPIRFYDFATFFKEQGCKNALYLDGAVSRTYLPAKGYKNLYGNFGVIIGETRK